MRLGILNMRHLIIGQVGIKIIISITGGEESNPLQRICFNQDGRAQFCKNKCDKSSNFAVNTKHAIKEQSQSQSRFESEVGEGFQLIDLTFLVEQLRRG